MTVLYGTGITVTGSLSAAAPGDPFITGPGYGQGRFNLTISGVFVATFRVERSFDGGANWFPATNAGAAVTFTAPINEVMIEPEAGVRYRVNITAYTSGTLTYRFGQ